jgi:hypothetical protein
MFANPYLRAIWLGIVFQLAGRLLDLRWHLTHDHFEGAADQLQAHWLAWLGILVTAVATTLAVTRLGPRARNLGYPIALLGCAVYIPAAIWHFIEHASGSDPELAHVLLTIGQVTIIAGAIVVLIASRRDPHEARP